MRALRRNGLTLPEVLVILILIVILIAILLPALPRHRYAPKVISQSQVNVLSTACESYIVQFRHAPGYLPDSYFNPTTAKTFTANENVVLSLLGGIVKVSDRGMDVVPPPVDFPSDVKIDVNNIGGGSFCGHIYGAFYSPKATELAAVKGTVDPDNNMFKFVDVVSGVPILYYRFPANAKVKDWYDGTSVGRMANSNFFDAGMLKGWYSQKTSLLRSPYDPMDILGTAINPSRQPQTQEGFLFTSPGLDGIYFAAEQAKPGQHGINLLDCFDDVRARGGN